MNISAIPTKYNGVQFRSRLEARWAAFFDLLGWPWEYEPIDLDGYIPDFVLGFSRPLLVEVKPALDFADMAEAFRKIEQSGWQNEAIVVGAKLWWSAGWNRPVVGRFVFDSWMSPDSQNLSNCHMDSESDAVLFSCSDCGGPSFYHSRNSYQCRANGCYDGDHHLTGGPCVDFHSLWREAGNRVQWLGKSTRPRSRYSRRATKARVPRYIPDLKPLPEPSPEDLVPIEEIREALRNLMVEG